MSFENVCGFDLQAGLIGVLEMVFGFVRLGIWKIGILKLKMRQVRIG